ncbi:MAG: hypothetical protein IT450_16245 [Phycisphaerales bacterium]|nr:hypothetical protein [Phycisphaerales bacterium]
MTRRRHVGRNLRAAAFLPIAVALCGCVQHPVEIRPAAEARAAMERITSNLERIDGPLNCSGLVTFRFRDTEGQKRSFFAQPTAVVVEKPHNLLFAIRHSLGDTIAQIGSNEDRYWLWVNLPEVRKLWWGTWTALDAGQTPRIVVTPRQLLDAWLLTPVAVSLPDGDPPLLFQQGEFRWLVFTARDQDGWPGACREMHLDRLAPYLPVRIIDRDAAGTILMDAELGGYRRIDEAGADAPYTPRRYVVNWPVGEAELRLDFDRVRYRTSDVPYNEFPERWQGERERLDEPAPLLKMEPADD